MDSIPAPRQRRPRPAERRQTSHEVDGRVLFARKRKGPPPDLVGSEDRPPPAAFGGAREARGEVFGAKLQGVEGLMSDRWLGAVEPGATLRGARGREGGARDLLGVEAKGADLFFSFFLKRRRLREIEEKKKPAASASERATTRSFFSLMVK